MNGSGKGRDAGLSLASVTTTSHSDVNIQHAGVAGHREWLQNSVPVLRLMEVLNEWLSIYCDSARASAHINYSLRCLALSKAPCATLSIQLWLTLFLRKSPSEVEKIDTIVLGEVIGGAFKSLKTIKRIGVNLICKFAQMGAHVMLVEWVLSHCVEQGDFLVLLRSQASNGVISEGIIMLDFSQYFFGKEFLVSCQLLNLRLIIEPVGLFRVKGLNDVLLPVKVGLIFVFRGRQRLLENVLGVVPVVHDTGLG